MGVKKTNKGGGWGMVGARSAGVPAGEVVAGARREEREPGAVASPRDERARGLAPRADAAEFCVCCVFCVVCVVVLLFFFGGCVVVFCVFFFV